MQAVLHRPFCISVKSSYLKMESEYQSLGSAVTYSKWNDLDWFKKLETVFFLDKCIA